MCYSSLIEKAYEEYVKMFRAPYDMAAFHRLYRQRELDLLLKIPAELDEVLISVDPINAGIIRDSVRAWAANCQAELTRLDIEIAQLQAALPKKASAELKKPLNEAKNRRKRINTALNSKPADGDAYRIYPKYFAPVIFEEDGVRKTVPMRFRVLPRNGIEMPDDYNLYNAVRDNLTLRKTWKVLFGKNHAIYPFLQFYEWLKPHGKSVEVSFRPDGYDRMWSACLYEEYQSPELGLIRSFAIVTDNPPPEIAAAGHDRCPIFLAENAIDAWLHPQGKSLEELDALLDNLQPTHFSNSLAA